MLTTSGKNGKNKTAFNITHLSTYLPSFVKRRVAFAEMKNFGLRRFFEL
jgi:hypothetical protein